MTTGERGNIRKNSTEEKAVGEKGEKKDEDAVVGTADVGGKKAKVRRRVGFL